MGVFLCLPFSLWLDKGKRLPDTYHMPTGGLMIPHSPELWAKVKDLVLQGLAYKDIAAQTGIDARVIRTKACSNKWTVIKAKKKAEAQLESLRPHLHKHLHDLSRNTKVPQTSSAKRLKEVADLVLTLAQTTKLVEGWQDQQEQTLVNVLQISNSVTANPPKQLPVGIDPVLDVEQSNLIPGQSPPETKG